VTAAERYPAAAVQAPELSPAAGEDRTVGRVVELAAGQWSWGDWLLVCAAHDLDDGVAAAGLRRLCITLAPAALCRVVEAVLLLRPDAAHQPGGGRAR